jgi:hypothetical protein
MPGSNYSSHYQVSGLIEINSGTGIADAML